MPNIENPKIKQAIAEGEALLLEKKKAEIAELQRKAREKEEHDAKQRGYAASWVENMLPQEIKEQTAKGNRYYETTNDWTGEALKLAGWEVKSRWVERSMDEGFDYGSYYIYRIEW